MEAKDYLAIIRDRGGLTQMEISAKTGIPQSTISKIERGTVADVMSRNYRALQTLCIEVAPDLASPAALAPVAEAVAAACQPAQQGAV